MLTISLIDLKLNLFVVFALYIGTTAFEMVMASLALLLLVFEGIICNVPRIQRVRTYLPGIFLESSIYSRIQDCLTLGNNDNTGVVCEVACKGNKDDSIASNG